MAKGRLFKHRNNFRRILLTSAVALGISSAASANTIGSITYTFTQGFSTTELNLSPVLKKFNAGTDGIDPTASLVSFYLSGTGDIQGSVSGTNNAAQAQTFTVGVNSDGTFSIPVSSGLTLDLIPGFSKKYTSVASGASFGPTAITGTDTESTALDTNATDLAQVTGAGTITGSYSTLSGQSIAGGGGNIVANVSLAADASLSITYNYSIPDVSTTPEPATFALFGGALLGAGLLRKRMVR